MHIKRYQAPDMRRALKKVTEDLGSEAVILSNRKTANGVELWASGGERQGAEVPEAPETRERLNADSVKAEPIKAKKAQRAYDRSTIDAHIAADTGSNMKGRSAHAMQASMERIRENSKALLKNDLLKRELNKQSDESEGVKRETPDMIAMRLELASVKDDLRKQTEMINQLSAALSSQAEASRPIERPAEQASMADASMVAGLKTRAGDEGGQSEGRERRDREDREDREDRKRETAKAKGRALLLQMGFDRSLVDQWLAELCSRDGDQGAPLSPSAFPAARPQWYEIETLLCSKTPVLSGECWKAGEQKRYIFLGPTGVGKTTTIGKIASRYILETHSPNTLALVTTDVLRNGAADHLKRFAKQLGCAFYRVAQGKPLDKILMKLRSKQLVLVDTAGVTPNDPLWERHCDQLQCCRSMLEPVLVLPATLQRRVLASVVNDYQPFQCGMAIISKLDESLSMGEVLSTVIDGPMKIAYVTDGISVADDLHQPKANELIRFAKHLGEQVDSDKAHRYAGSNDVRAGKAFEMLNSM